jgi:hypothetical protein
MKPSTDQRALSSFSSDHLLIVSILYIVYLSKIKHNKPIIGSNIHKLFGPAPITYLYYSPRKHPKIYFVEMGINYVESVV